jgi:alkyl sulfatase BDS1-like metallo-beta-lactamase superfamily hydrolase
MIFTDLGEAYGLRVENGVLNHGKPLANPDSTLTLSKQTLDAIQLKQTTMQDAIARGDVKVEGRPGAFAELMEMLVTYPGWFNIVTP